MLDFLSGMTTMGFVIAGLFFFRFWARTKDQIFIYFGLSFCLLAISQALGTLPDIRGDDRTWIYLLRLVAFMLLIVAILSKNLRQSAGRTGE
jgi:Family of unknown function (DUF5985)